MSELELLKRRLERERTARKQAEQILESKALELFKVNESLQKLNESLESQINQRTQDLQKSEEKYRNVIEQATDIIYSTDEEGYFTFINPLGSNAFGFSQKDILGKRYIDFVPDEYKTGLFQYYTNMKEGDAESDYYEFPIKSKSGEIHWIGQNVNRITSESGEIYFNAVARDITLRKKTEKELEELRQALLQSEVKYRSVLENMDLGLMEVDTNGKIRRVYDKFCWMTGYTKDELIGKDAVETLIVEEYEDIIRNQDNNRLEGQSEVYEVQLRRKDNKHIWVLISGAPFYNSDGDIIGSLGIHYDITDRKILEQNLIVERQKAIKAQQAEQQFLANMSHEIRTPLNAIVGMSHLLKDSDLNEKQNELVEILSDSASLLKGLVSDILDISKIDSGMAESNESSFDLAELATSLVKTFGHRAAEKGLSLIPKIECLNSCIVKSDRQWLNQILINLLGNAVKFTAKGEIHLIIKKLKNNDKNDVYYFEVKDTGIGISEKEVKIVFSSFKQANTKVRREYGGTGLGLSISSRLVSLLGGELYVDSEEGKGSRFYFSLSLKSSVGEALKPINIHEYKLDTGRKVRILVVEDNLMNQKYILTLLSKWKIDYDIADNGAIAVEKFKLNHYDIIFMDLSMPVMDGYEATSIIRSLQGKQVPIVALTASTFLSKKELALKSGMSDFLAKPFTPDDLSQMIKKHLSAEVEVVGVQKGDIKEEHGKLINIDENNIKERTADDSRIEIDRKQLEIMYSTDYAHALDMFKTYKEVILHEIDTLSSIGYKGSVENVKKQAHKIKPMFLMVGLNSISVCCETIERFTSNEEVLKVQETIAEVKEKAINTLPLIDIEIERLEKFVN